MSVSLTLDESQVFTALGNFLTAVLPQGTTVLQGQLNRVAEPTTPNFVVMWDILKGRIETNVDSYVDAVFQGSVTGTELTITEVFSGFSGQIEVGSTIFGTGVAGGTEVTELGSGTGGVGTYTVNNSQTVGSSGSHVLFASNDNCT